MRKENLPYLRILKPQLHIYIFIEHSKTINISVKAPTSLARFSFLNYTFHNFLKVLS